MCFSCDDYDYYDKDDYVVDDVADKDDYKALDNDQDDDEVEHVDDADDIGGDNDHDHGVESIIDDKL